ncbi:MAG: xanthine dehydrogenase family protein molybdopterin-binding subunit [Anaerolineales bacterium]|nr:xanthine dehydrogenase family protein molybdopterin-binding subunit [Anaerolineales bacterium]
MKFEETILGTSPARIDARAKVAGTARYVADIAPANLAAGVILRSPHHHARIRNLDISAAQDLPGVLAVITHADVPGASMYGALIQDRPVLAGEVVRFIGEPIALVVAKTRSIAEEARSLINVEYEPMPSVHDPVEALQPGTPSIHPDGNQIALFEVGEGDPEEGFKEADVILEETFFVPRIYPGYLEPEASLAVWEDDVLTVWVSSQHPFYDRFKISTVLDLPEEKIHVRSEAIGGAFGGKEDSNLPILTSLAAFHIRGAVRFVNTRTESILGHPKRHPCRLHYKVGARHDGTLTALTAVVHVDTGAYASYGPAVAQLLTETIPGPYRIPNTYAQTYVVYTNNLIGGAMRGFGSPQTNFAYESLMDMLAVKLDMDSTELRRRNIWREGDTNYTRAKINQAHAAEKILAHAQKEKQRLSAIPASPGKKSGVGIAMAVQTMGLGRGVPDDSSHRLEWLPDGRVRLYLGAPDLGQGLQTAAAQMTASVLGLPFENIDVQPIDTTTTPNGGTTCASRMTYMVGNAVVQAGEALVGELLVQAALLLDIPRGTLRYERGMVYQKDRQEPIPVEELTSRLAENDVSLAHTATFSFPYGPETPDHLPVGMPHTIFCLGAQVARVEVDPETGQVDVTDIAAVHDLGRVIYRQGVEGQIEGGVAMGMGYALTEEVKLKADGQWVSNLTEYLMMTAADMPPRITMILLEEPEDSSEFGVKGIGEIALVPTAAAIANGVAAATGIRVHRLPIQPEDLIS